MDTNSPHRRTLPRNERTRKLGLVSVVPEGQLPVVEVVPVVIDTAVALVDEDADMVLEETRNPWSKTCQRGWRVRQKGGRYNRKSAGQYRGKCPSMMHTKYNQA
jgi:hypothetical protein